MIGGLFGFVTGKSAIIETIDINVDGYEVDPLLYGAGVVDVSRAREEHDTSTTSKSYTACAASDGLCVYNRGGVQVWGACPEWSKLNPCPYGGY